MKRLLRHRRCETTVDRVGLLPIADALHITSAILVFSHSLGQKRKLSAYNYSEARMTSSELRLAIDALKAFNKSSDPAAQFIEVISANEEIVIGGNQEGLSWLALQLAELALKNTEFAHLHLDAAGAADGADVPVVFRLSSAK